MISNSQSTLPSSQSTQAVGMTMSAIGSWHDWTVKAIFAMKPLVRMEWSHPASTVTQLSLKDLCVHLGKTLFSDTHTLRFIPTSPLHVGHFYKMTLTASPVGGWVVHFAMSWPCTAMIPRCLGLFNGIWALVLPLCGHKQVANWRALSLVTACYCC